MKRFYSAVTVTPELGIALDDRPVKTPARAPLILPNAALADHVADEWRAQGDQINPQSMPLTGLANASIDRVAPDRDSFASALAVFAESELLCYRAADPPELIARQDQVWTPILGWAQARYDVSFTLVTGIMHQPQPAQTLSRLAQALHSRTAWELAALNPIVTISGSLVIALAVLEKHIAPDVAFAAAHLDEIWQAEQWGEDDWAMDTRRAHERDFLEACRFLDLVMETEDSGTRPAQP